jgi:hypothetical protein
MVFFIHICLDAGVAGAAENTVVEAAEDGQFPFTKLKPILQNKNYLKLIYPNTLLIRPT